MPVPVRALLPTLLGAALLTACGGAAPTVEPTPSPQATTSPSPSASPTVDPTERPTPKPTGGAGLYFFHKDRRPVLDSAIASGFTCGEEFLLEDGKPAVRCAYPGATESEGLVVIGPANDLLAVRLHSDEGDKMADFLFSFAPAGGTEWVLAELDEVTRTGILPVTTSKSFGDYIMRLELIEPATTAIITVQATDV